MHYSIENLALLIANEFNIVTPKGPLKYDPEGPNGNIFLGADTMGRSFTMQLTIDVPNQPQEMYVGNIPQSQERMTVSLRYTGNDNYEESLAVIERVYSLIRYYKTFDKYNIITMNAEKPRLVGFFQRKYQFIVMWYVIAAVSPTNDTEFNDTF